MNAPESTAPAYDPRAQKPVACVGALVRGPSGRVLIVRTTKWSGQWGVAGGKIEQGERAADAVVREFAEEVGLTIVNPRFVCVQEAINDPVFFRPAHLLLLNYLADTDAESVVPNEEIAEWAWVGPREALARYPLNRYTVELIELALADPGFMSRITEVSPS